MEVEQFCLNDYDCIGFDLDCTLAEYNVKELTKLIYHLLSDFLVKKKSYPRECLAKAIEEDEYFMQKGLFVDLKRGNVLKIIGSEGTIWKACHGTSPLAEEDVVKAYGPNKTLPGLKEFQNDPLSIFNTENQKVMRTFLDIFDTPCTLIFARIIDDLDKTKGKTSAEYNIWPDILEELKKNPSKYYVQWDLKKMLWLKELKEKKFTFLLTGSFIDFASLTASMCIGQNWKDYFDVILCYGKKPFFFASDNPFLNVDGTKETEPVKRDALTTNSIYTQGNWKELKALISKHTNKKQPNCLYIGDNLIQDVFAPVHFKCCDAIAVSFELKNYYTDSKLWGSYFGVDDHFTTYWNHLIKYHSKICISDLGVLVKNSINFKYASLKDGKTNEITESNGYYM